MAFWSLTPRLWLIEMGAAVARMQRAAEQGVRLAWLTAGLQRAAKLPKLSALLDRPERRRVVSVEWFDHQRRVLPVITMDEWEARHGR